MEYLHHGDALVPRQQRFGQYTRSLMKALGVPVMNQYGLRPALVKGTTQIAPLTISKDLDKLGLLNGVTTFNFHPHLPHYALTTDDTKSVHVLTRQPIDLGRPHPFTKLAIRSSTPASGCRPITNAALSTTKAIIPTVKRAISRTKYRTRSWNTNPRPSPTTKDNATGTQKLKRKRAGWEQHFWFRAKELS